MRPLKSICLGHTDRRPDLGLCSNQIENAHCVLSSNSSKATTMVNERIEPIKATIFKKKVPGTQVPSTPSLLVRAPVWSFPSAAVFPASRILPPSHFVFGDGSSNAIPSRSRSSHLWLLLPDLRHRQRPLPLRHLAPIRLTSLPSGGLFPPPYGTYLVDVFALGRPLSTAIWHLSG